MPTTHAPALPRAATSNAAIFSLLLVVDSLHYVFARGLLPYFDPLISANLVLWVATIEIGIYGIWRRKIHWESARRHFWFYAVIGFLVGTSTALGYSSMEFIDAGTASMLSKTSTLFSIVVGMVWLREQLRPTQLVGALLALVGVVLITFQPGDLLRWGAAIVLVSTAMYALHTAIVKRYGDHIDFLDFFFFRVLFTSITLAIIALARPFVPPTAPEAWVILVVAGTSDVVISRTLYYIALRRLSMSLHAIILTLSPVLTVVWSLLLFGAYPKPLQFVGGIVVVVGVALAAVRR